MLRYLANNQLKGMMPPSLLSNSERLAAFQRLAKRINQMSVMYERPRTTIYV